MMVFENGNALKYDTDHALDEYGSLGDQKVAANSEVVEITDNDFHMKWDSTEALNS